MANKDLEKAMLNILHGLKDTQRKMEQRQELKTWSDISVPLSLKAVLSSFTKDELSDIRKRLEIQGASQLKKAELVDLLNLKIPHMLDKICTEMDLDRYKMVKEIIRNGGYIMAPKLEAHQLAYLRNSGILFTGTFKGKKIIGMPEDIVKNPFFQENDKEIRAICSRNSEWIKLTQGLLYYYGTLSFIELVDLMGKYTGEPIRVREYMDIIYCARKYYKHFRYDQTGYSYYRVFDPKKVKQEHQMRKDLDFYPFTKERLLKAGEPGYVERNESYRNFVRFLTQNYEMTNNEADEIAQECLYAANMGESPNHIMQFLSEILEFENLESVRACMDQVVNLMNNTKKWILKGYTSIELRPSDLKALKPLPKDQTNIVDFKTKKKIGRNDPCPCGSGKKYKLCCGR